MIGAIDGVSFDNVVGKADTVPGVPVKRRTFQPDTEGNAGFVGGHASAPDDRERQAALSGLNDALWNLSWRGGGMNMRSKRELFGQLLNQKNDLTSQAFQENSRRNIANAQLDNEAGQGNAQLAEQGARRRGDSRQFYDELGSKLDMYQQDRQDKIAAANSPDARLATAKAALDLEALKANQARSQEDHDALLGGKFENTFAARAKTLQAGGATPEQIAVEAAKAAQQQGLPLNASPSSAAGWANTQKRLADVFNNHGNTTLYNVQGIGDDAAPWGSLDSDYLNVKPADIKDPNAVRAERTGVLRRYLLGAPAYRYEITNAKTHKPQALYDDDPALYNDLLDFQSGAGR